jgi:two-component system response regulator FixJ
MTSAPQILLIEADEAVRASLKFSLELEGFGVTAVASAQGVFSKEALPTDGCLVIDQGRGGGLSLLTTLRQKGCTLPAVVTATNPDRNLRRAAAEAGVTLVEKPLLGDALSDVLRRIVQPQVETT